MIAILINIVIWLLIVGVVFWAIKYIASILPLDPTIKRAIDVVITVFAVIVVLIILLNLIGMLTHVDLNLPRVG